MDQWRPNLKQIQTVDLGATLLDLKADFSIQHRDQLPGPPQRTEAMTLGVVHMTESPPHGGEVHPDGDEVLYVISGHVTVFGDSSPQPLSLTTGACCVVPQGEWHRVQVEEPSTLLFVTPGPNGDHRPR